MCDPVTAAIIIGQGASMIQAKKAQKSADAIAQASFDADMQQIKDNRRDVALEAAQAGNSLAQIFQEKQASNRALLQSSGISSSMSLNAFYKDAMATQKQDLNSVALTAGRKYSDLAYKAQDSRLQLASKKAASKSAKDSAFIKGATGIAKAAGGLQFNKGQQVGSGSKNYKFYTPSDKALSESSSFKSRFKT